VSSRFHCFRGHGTTGSIMKRGVVRRINMFGCKFHGENIPPHRGGTSMKRLRWACLPRTTSECCPLSLLKTHFPGWACRNPYDVTWPHSYPDNCPNLVAKHTHFFGEEGNKGNDSNNHVNRNNDGIAVEVRRSKDSITHHESLAHLWNDWYSEYYDPIESFPRIMVRYEDLLFHTQEVISKVCTTCMGGTIPYKKVKLLPTSAKLASAHKSRTGLLEAMIHYGSAKRRLEGFTRDDVIFANQHLNTDLMTTFGYPLAPSKQ